MALLNDTYPLFYLEGISIDRISPVVKYATKRHNLVSHFSRLQFFLLNFVEILSLQRLLCIQHFSSKMTNFEKPNIITHLNPKAYSGIIFQHLLVHFQLNLELLFFLQSTLL